MTTGLVPAIGYIRVSTWFEEKISDEIQKAVVEDAAHRRGRVIVRWVVDLDATGRNFKRRIMEAIDAVETGAFEGAREIWVWKFSRFGRNRHGIAVNLARVEHAGGQLISATEEIDATTATGRFARGMMFELAAFESERIGEQWKETHEIRRRRGLPATGGHRFGYLWTPHVDAAGHVQEEGYEPDPASAPALVDIYQRYADGMGFLPLVKRLNSDGHVNPHRLTKGAWSMQSLAQYMDTGFAAGLLHAHLQDGCPKPSQCRSPREHYGYLPGAQPPILSDDLWEAYRARRQQRKARPPRSRIPIHPFTGIIRCGLCGGSAAAYTVDGQRGGGWRCTRSVNGSGACNGATVTTRRILREVNDWLKDIDKAIDERSYGTRVEPLVERADTSKDRERLAGRIAQLEEALVRASTSHALGDMPRAAYLATRDKLQGESEEKKRELQVILDAEEVQPALVGALLEHVRLLREEWDTLPVVAINDLLGVVLKEIRIWPKAFEPRVVLVPAGSLMVFQS